MMRERMSRPSSSDPQTCANDGGESRVARLICAGSCGASHGANTAQTVKKTTNTTPIAASGLRRVSRGTEMAIADNSQCANGNLISRALVSHRRRREFLAHPLLESVHILFAAQEILHQRVGRDRYARLQYCVPIPHRSLPRQQIIVT